MFTGLVEGIGKVREIHRMRGALRLSIVPLFDMAEVRTGESICVAGVCLTVTDIKEGCFSVDVSGETLSRSTVGSLKQGDEVNLERALRLTDRLGGHLVTGHVDGLGRILRKEQEQGSWRLEIGVDHALGRHLVEKGSVAVDGVSLTINHCFEAGFEVNIIPQTERETTILKKKVGDHVNIETDLIGKYVEKLLWKDGSVDRQKSEKVSAIDREMLEKYGFSDSY
jgi:riboflavin synthase